MCPDHRQHRGAHPDDASLFCDRTLPDLQAAVADLSWLLTRGYAPVSSLKLVGDRYNLRERQRIAVGRASCSDANRERRQQAEVGLEAASGTNFVVDGFNILITVEAALGGGVLLRCRDGCIRDLSGVHGSYRAVEETDRALNLIGTELAALAPRSVLWLLDSPISNSGMLAARIRALAETNGWPWTVELPFNPDKVMRESQAVAVSSDALILDGAGRWHNLATGLLLRHIPDARILPLSGPRSNEVEPPF